jgi:hypothetical protein
MKAKTQERTIKILSITCFKNFPMEKFVFNLKK